MFYNNVEACEDKYLLLTMHNIMQKKNYTYSDYDNE